jgi:hypothetical protein
MYANLNCAPNQFDRYWVPVLDFEFHTKSPVACNLPFNIEREVTGHRGLDLFQVWDRHIIECIFGICGGRLAGFSCGDIGCLFRRSIGRFLGHLCGVQLAPARMLQVLPAVRALAHKLDVDLNAVQATGPGGTITQADVERAAKSLAEAGPAEALRGMRRAMAQRMAAAHAEVVPATVTDDAEMHFPKEGVVLSRESRSSEKFMHGIKVLMAKNYIDNLSEEARKGMQEKAEQGIWPTKTPLGYRNGLAFVGTLRVVGGRRTACPRFAIWVPSGSGKLKQLEYGAKLTQSGGGRIVGQMVWRTTATSASGTFETGLWTPKTSACRGRPEVIGGRSKRRD